MTPGTSGSEDQRPFLLQVEGKPNKNRAKTKNKIRFCFVKLARVLGLSPYINKQTKISPKIQPGRGKTKISFFYPPDPATAPPLRRPDPRAHPGLRPRPRCPGVGPPRAAPREMRPDPGVSRRYPGSAPPPPRSEVDRYEQSWLLVMSLALRRKGGGTPPWDFILYSRCQI